MSLAFEAKSVGALGLWALSLITLLTTLFVGWPTHKLLAGNSWVDLFASYLQVTRELAYSQVTTIVNDFWNSSHAPHMSTCGCSSDDLLVSQFQVPLNVQFFTNSRLNSYTLNSTKIQENKCMDYNQIDTE